MDISAENILREAAACGDIKKVQEIVSKNRSTVNSQHSINGW